MPVGRAPDVARGPRALGGAPFACTLSLAPAPGIIVPFTLSCRTGEAWRQKQGGAGGIISPACLSCLFCLSLPFSLPAEVGGADFGVFEHVFAGAFEDDGADFEDVGVVGDGEGGVGVLFHEEHGFYRLR